MISIYHYDGTVACTHAGIEMGQGLHTKVLQTIAQSFQIPTDKINLKPSNNFVGANALCTGGSVGSEIVCFVMTFPLLFYLHLCHIFEITVSDLYIGCT